MLFYSSLYIGELYKNSLDIDVTAVAPSMAVAIDAEITRIASRALLYSVLLSLAMNLTMPALVVQQDDGEGECGSNMPEYWLGRWAWWMNMRRVRFIHLATLWAVGHAVFAICMASTM